MKNGIVGVVGIVMCVASVAVMAKLRVREMKSYQYDPAGIFIAGGAGYGISKFAHLNNTKGFSWLASGGYRFNKYFGVEAGYMEMAGIELAGKTFVPSATYLAAKGYYPLTKKFTLFVKAGAARTSIKKEAVKIASFHEHEVEPLVGGGIDFNINNNLALTFQVVSTINLHKGQSFPKMYGALVGLTYTF